MLAQPAGGGEKVGAIICFDCGEHNIPTAAECASCHTRLTTICPACGASIEVDAATCPKCHLRNDDRYDVSLRLEVARAESVARGRRRSYLARDRFFSVLIATCALIACWQLFAGNGFARNVAAFVALLYLAIWLTIKIVK